jgi:alkaline phosphatase D
LLPVPERAIPFRTFPDPRLPSGNHFRFIVSSCSTPNFPYRPLHGRRIKGYDLLHDYLFPVQPRAPAAGEALSVEDVLLGEDVPDSVPTASTDEVRAEVTPNVTAEDTGGIPEPTSSDDPVVPATPVPEPAPQADFMLFLGDFIYADVPIWWGESKEAYRRLYRRTYNSPR